LSALPLILAMALAGQAPDPGLDAFCLKIEESLRNADPAPLDRALDVEALLDRAVRGLAGDAKSLEGFRAGVRKGFSYGPALVRQLGKEGRVKFLRVRRVGTERRALFRTLLGEQFSYQEFLLDPRPGGELRIADIYVFLTAEWLSENLRRSYLSVLAAEPGALEKALGGENEYAKSMPRIQELSKLAREGKHEEVLKGWDGLPAAAKKDKSLLVLRCTSAARVGAEEALRALEDLRKAVPGDPCIPILSIGPLTDAGKHAEALRAVDDLDRDLGGDPFLHVLRSWIHSAAGDAERARASARKAIEGDRTLAIAYWTAVNLSLEARRFGETANLLSELEKNAGIRVDELRGEQFAEFLKSPEHEAWRKGKGKP